MHQLEKLIDDCRQLLAEGDLSQALERLSEPIFSASRDLRNEVLLHSSRLRAIYDHERKGLLLPAHADAQRIQLTLAVLELLDEVPAKLGFSKPLENDTEALIPPKTSSPHEWSQGESVVKSFDVFLSHNSADKPVVTELAIALKERGLHVWLDVWELRPGTSWQTELERVLGSIRSAAVCVGPNGPGPWQVPEMQVCLDEFVRRSLPVIPVLLPGTINRPKLPLFLAQLTWIDLTTGLTREGLDRLEWGITGQNKNDNRT